LGVKILKFFYADPGSGIFLTLDTGSGMEKIRVRDKHPGSATLPPTNLNCLSLAVVKICLHINILGEFFYFAPLFRPAWEEGWTRERLEMNEQRSFREYVTRHSRLK
jgi:hypothetical protein